MVDTGQTIKKKKCQSKLNTYVQYEMSVYTTYTKKKMFTYRMPWKISVYEFWLFHSIDWNRKNKPGNVNRLFLSILTFVTVINILLNSSSLVFSLLKFQWGNRLNTAYIYIYISLLSNSSVDKWSKCLHVCPNLCLSVHPSSR